MAIRPEGFRDPALGRRCLPMASGQRSPKANDHSLLCRSCSGFEFPFGSMYLHSIDFGP